MLQLKRTTFKTAQKYGFDFQNFVEHMADYEISLKTPKANDKVIWQDTEDGTTFYPVTFRCECGNKGADVYGTEMVLIVQCGCCGKNYYENEYDLM